MSLSSRALSRRSHRAWEFDRDLVAKLAGSPRATLVGRLLARLELSMLGSGPPMMSVVLLAPTWPLIALSIRLHGLALLMITLSWTAFGLLALLLEAGRAIWVARHPFASRRWLYAVAAVVGPTTITAVLHHLAVANRSDPDYAIRRWDVTIWVRGERRQHRDAAKRDMGVRLAHDLPLA